MITANETPINVISAKELVKAEDKLLSPVSEVKSLKKTIKLSPTKKTCNPVKR